MIEIHDHGPSHPIRYSWTPIRCTASFYWSIRRIGCAILFVLTYMATIEHIFSGICRQRRWRQIETFLTDCTNNSAIRSNCVWILCSYYNNAAIAHQQIATLSVEVSSNFGLQLRWIFIKIWCRMFQPRIAARTFHRWLIERRCTVEYVSIAFHHHRMVIEPNF